MKFEGVGTAFIGLYRVAEGLGHTFYTVNSVVPKYSNWIAGEPNDHQGKEDCVEIVYKAQYYGSGKLDIRGQWNDAPCNGVHEVPNHFVCELSFKKYGS